MKKLMIGLVVSLTVGGLAVAALGGMSWLDDLGLRGPERQVRSRMLGYWEARLKADMQGMGEFIHPAQTTLPNPGMLVTEAYEIQDLAVDGDAAVATVKLRSRLKHSLFSQMTREVTIEDRWVRYKGQWFKQPGPVTMYDAIQSHRGRWTPPVVPEAATP